MVWKRFSVLLALSDHKEFPSQRASSAGFDIVFDVSRNKLLNKHSICHWFETPWCSCGVTVMIFFNFLQGANE